ncbi:MAG: hemerythrin domain-containing protein [Candidatus Sulfotelmatobacter sp.]
MENIEKSTQVLREEHRLIESAILAFTVIIKDLDAGAALNRRRVWEIAQSFKTYVGRCHHSKEDFLLSMVRARGGSSAEYPFRTFYEEHRHIQSILSDLAKAAHEYLEALPGTPESLVSCLRNVVDFYPGHMWKAEHLLFPLADEVLSETDQGVLIQQFDWIESVVGADTDEELRAIVAEFRPEPSRAA